MRIHWELNASRRSPAFSFHLGKLLVVAQVALSLPVLICAGLLLRSLVNLETLDVGFNREHVLAVSLNGNAAGRSAGQVQSFYDRLLERSRELPGVRSASFSALTPIGGREIGINVAVESRSPGPGSQEHVFLSSVTPGYFRTLEIPLLAGRDFTVHDDAASPRVAIINRTMAHRFFGDADPLGKRFRFVEGTRPPLEIVGVVGDSKYHDLREETPDFVYLSRYQAGPSSTVAGVLHVRTGPNSTRALVAPLRELVHSLDSSVAITGVRTLQEQIDESLRQDRLISTLCGAFSLLALILTCVGLYGTVSAGVARRRGELGIRMALGAPRSRVLRLVLREVMWLVLAGVGLGIPIALAASRLISGMLFGLPAHDPFTIALSTATLLGVALLAGYLPARRASRIDPMAALRCE